MDKSFPQETACQHRIQSHTEEARKADDIPVLWVAGRWLKFSEPLRPDLEDDWGQRSEPLSQVQLHGPHHSTHQCQAWLPGSAGPVSGQTFSKLSRPLSLTTAWPTSTPPPTALRVAQGQILEMRRQGQEFPSQSPEPHRLADLPGSRTQATVLAVLSGSRTGRGMTRFCLLLHLGSWGGHNALG